MSEIVISGQNVSKAYRIWNSPAGRLSAPLMEWGAGLFPPAAKWLKQRATNQYRDFWALKDVSFEIKKGEIVGIIGRNGSGKSTLLQIIAGTLQSTNGSVQAIGRVAALLELGSGFNPDFTGRENVYLNAAILGLTRQQIEGKFGEILSFADIGDFIEQPVKTYSSGMLVRLAFAVQIQLDPEILIVDEALSVGDEPFQRKCYTQIALMRERGVTILFVSHSAATVVELCQRVILLDHGKHLITATPKIAVQCYHQLCYSPVNQLDRVRLDIAQLATPKEIEADLPPTAQSERVEAISEKGTAYFIENMQSTSRNEYPPRGAIIDLVQILDTEFLPVNMLVKGNDYILRWRVRFADDVTRVRFGWSAKTVTGAVISGAATHTEGDGFKSFSAGTVLEVDFNFCCLFNPGTYFIDAAVRSELPEPDTLLHGIVDVLMFKSQPTPRIHRNGHIDTSRDPAWAVRAVTQNII